MKYTSAGSFQGGGLALLADLSGGKLGFDCQVANTGEAILCTVNLSAAVLLSSHYFRLTSTHWKSNR